MNRNKERPRVTAGLDLGDNYSYLCLVDTDGGEVIEEGRVRTTPEALRRRFASERPLFIQSRKKGDYSQVPLIRVLGRRGVSPKLTAQEETL